MKKTTMIGLATLMAAALSYGQGTVVFANAGATISNILTLAPVPAGSIFAVALYWLPDSPTAPTTADFDAAGPGARAAVATNFAGAGIFSAGTVRIEGITPPGANAWFQVRAWERLYGGRVVNSYEEALTTPVDPGQARPILAGTSNIFKVDTGDPTTTPPGTPAPIYGAGKLQGFYVVPVPEPSLVGLGVLGIGALLMLRRRS